MPQPPVYLTARQAADRLTAAGMPVSKETVQRWCREGSIAANRLPGGHYRIPVEAVDACLVPPAEVGA